MKIILALIIFFSLIRQAESQSLKSINGRWINYTYVQELRKYRDPKSAEANTNIFYFDLRNDTICITDDLHTSNNYNVLKRITSKNDKTYFFFFEDDSVQQCIIIEDTNKVRWIGRFRGFNKYVNVNTEFIKLLKPIEYLCNELIIAGTYYDKKGNKYQFDSNGKAKWPGRAFKYETCISYYGIDMNCIIDYMKYNNKDKSYAVYGFKFINNNLYLYKEKYSENDCTYFQNKPFLILTKE